MKKTLNKAVAILTALVITLTALAISPISVSAASSPVDVESNKIAIWADAENVLTQTDIADFTGGNKLSVLGGIQPFKRTASPGGILGGITGGENTYYWFFPSNADLSALKIWFNEGSTVSIDGTALTSGMTTDAFADINEGGTTKSVTLTVDGQSYSVTAMKSGDVGTVYIDTQSGSLKTITNDDKHNAWESGSIMVVKPNGDVDYMGIMDKMSGRGNGTWSTDNVKNPYNIKLNRSASLLGMSSAKKWCLLANAGDSSLVKNQLTYDFADYIGIKYQPHCKPVDLYVNQQYLGSYQLAEKVEIKSNRIDISDAYENLEIANGTVDATTGAVIPADLTGTAVGSYTSTGSTASDGTTLSPTPIGQGVGNRRYSKNLTDPTDVTGGYLYELEISKRWVNENAGFCAFNRQGWVIKSADYATKNMVDYSYDLLFALGNSVYNGGTVGSTEVTTTCSKATSIGLNLTLPSTKTVTNPAPAAQYQGKKWSDLLDADSAVRYYWSQEFFKNMDSSTSSTYFYKESDALDSKLYAGPMWDMDNSIGYGQNDSRWGYSWTSSDGWYTRNARIYRWRTDDSTMTYSADNQSPLNFYAALYTNCSDFQELAKVYWTKYIDPAVDIITGKTTDPTGTLKSAEEYITTVAKSGAMNALRFDSSYDASSHISEMTNWFTQRQSWINTENKKSQIDISNSALDGIFVISDIPDQTYTGEAITPSIEFIGNGTEESHILTEGLNYDVSYENNINAGENTAVAKVRGLGLFTGTIEKTFTINPADIGNGYTLTVEGSTYKDTAVNALLTNDATGKEVTENITYQWYKNGAAINGATAQTYTTTEGDIGSVITCVATGDGTNLVGSVTSNSCTVLEGSRPGGYTRTIAQWNYDYTADSTALVNASTDINEYSYTATGGEKQSVSSLYASVNAVDSAKIKWSGTADLYLNDSGTAASDRTPIMGTSKTDGLAWGEYPYFEASTSTIGYEAIKFSAKLGGTKKAPKSWKLQYSLDGTGYTDVAGAAYSIVNNKTMELAFDNIALPSECDNQKTLYIRMVVTEDLAINGVNTIVNQTSGDASVNNISITGASLSVVTSLEKPTVVLPETDTVLFSDSTVEIIDNNGGADIYYSINGSEPVLYTGAFNPFNPKAAKTGDTAAITAYSKFEDIVSENATATVTFGGVDINTFSYDTYSKDVTNGEVQSTGGIYGESGRMTAYTDGNSQYVPLWREDNGSFCIAPDDGATWSESSGFTYKVSTAGFENINFSCMAYTTNSGPASITLQYSTNGKDFYNVQSNVPLTANKMLEQVFLTAELPAACDNQSVVYIRLATTENLNFLGTSLYSESKGNLYVNDVIIAGEDNGSYKMPYTNKSTSYFGETGIIEYISPDGLGMKYFVADSDKNVVQSGTYPETGIQLSTVKGFDKLKQEPYSVAIWVEEDDDVSLVNTATYCYKGETVVKFNYNDTTKLFNNYVSADFLSVSSTSGANTGTLSMLPDGTNATPLAYTGTYGVKVTYDPANPFTYTYNGLDNSSSNGCWLIETSTKGYKNLTLNAEQLSSNNGPRDWGVAYSTDGKSYTYIESSNVRAISNDASTKPVETYGNLTLPAECDNLDKLYIKVFINGGEAVDGDELNIVTKGNTGINGLEINGIPVSIPVEFKTTLLEAPGTDKGSEPLANVDVYVDGIYRTTTNNSGVAYVNFIEGASANIELKGNGIVTRAVSVTATTGISRQNVPLMAYDVNNDGYVNAKDFAIISKDSSKEGYKTYFKNFINIKTAEFVY